MTPVIDTRPVIADGDDAFLFNLYRSTRERELARVPWTDQDKTEFLVMQFTAQRTDYAERFPRGVHEIITCDGEDVGRMWVDAGPVEIRLLDITIAPERRNEGIGKVLLQRLQARAKAAGVPLRHSVSTDNVDALRFYERLGFAVVEDFELYQLMEWVDR